MSALDITPPYGEGVVMRLLESLPSNTNLTYTSSKYSVRPVEPNMVNGMRM